MWFKKPTPAKTETVASSRSYQLLDKEPTQELKDLVKESARMFGVQSAFFTLFDDHRQGVKSTCRIDPFHAPAVIRFCTNEILGRNVGFVSDTLEDKAYRNSPVVAGPPHIRFFAGAPAIDKHGHLLGLLCVLNDKPRPVAHNEIENYLQPLVSDMIKMVQMQSKATSADAYVKELFRREFARERRSKAS